MYLYLLRDPHAVYHYSGHYVDVICFVSISFHFGRQNYMVVFQQFVLPFYTVSGTLCAFLALYFRKDNFNVLLCNSL